MRVKEFKTDICSAHNFTSMPINEIFLTICKLYGWFQPTRTSSHYHHKTEAFLCVEHRATITLHHHSNQQKVSMRGGERKISHSLCACFRQVMDRRTGFALETAAKLLLPLYTTMYYVLLTKWWIGQEAIYQFGYSRSRPFCLAGAHARDRWLIHATLPYTIT